MTTEVLIGTIRNGNAEFIYSDQLLPYFDKLGGNRHTRRASHVEPSDHRPGCWMVDFAPLGGSKHYEDEQGRPLMDRCSALAYEVELLKEWMYGNSVLDPAVQVRLPN